MKKRKTLRKPWDEAEEINSVSYGGYQAFALRDGTVYITEGHKIRSKRKLVRYMTESGLMTHIDLWVKTSGAED